MIIYDQRSWGGLRLILELKGSVYPRVAPYAITASSMCLLFKAMEYGVDFDLSKLFTHPFVYQIYTFVLGFVLVFRCNLAYSRFWEGRTMLELMGDRWCDSCLQVIIFDNVSNKSETDRRAFRARVVSLFSLLHACALARLQDYQQPMEVIEGLHATETLEHINHADVKDQTFLIYTWILEMLGQRITQGGLATPAPITTRLFQELSLGMTGYNHACKIHETPFPFPYAQLITLALAIMTVTGGLVMNVFVSEWYWAALFCFVAVGGFHAVNEVAVLLEDPFGLDQNDLPLGDYQTDYNHRLRPMLRLDEHKFRSPGLSDSCSRMIQRRALQQLHVEARAKECAPTATMPYNRKESAPIPWSMQPDARAIVPGEELATEDNIPTTWTDAPWNKWKDAPMKMRWVSNLCVNEEDDDDCESAGDKAE